MIYVISKDTFGSYNVRDIQCNANWDCCPYSDYALIPDSMVEEILATRGYCDITLNDTGTEVASYTARSIPDVPEECCGTNTILSVNGVTANNDGELTLTPGDVGAAPGGYGLGAATWIGDGRSADTVMDNGWFAWGDNGVVDTPFVAGYMFVVARQNGKHVTQFAFNANYSGVGALQIVTRTYGTTGWSEWVGFDHSAFAPSGYGLGSAVYYDKNVPNITTVAGLDTALKCGWYPCAFADAGGYVTLNNINILHGVMFVSSYVDARVCQEMYVPQHGLKLTRWCYDGVFDEWECDNPPMQVGKIYRTTERHGGLPVYKQLTSDGVIWWSIDNINWQTEAERSGSVSNGGSGSSGEAGGYYIPNVELLNENTLQISFTASKTGMPSIATRTVTLAAGSLPSVTAADNGKILQVVNGAWAVVSAEESVIKTYVENYLNEALGGEY